MYLTEAQYEVQNRVDRKGTSTYYTSPDGVNVVRELLKGVPNKEGIVVMDPFMGSGVLLSAIDDLVKPSKVIGIEINKEPCELGRKILSSLYPEVEVLCGDAFKLAWKYRADLVVSNPPFVRWHLIQDREKVLELVASKGYGNFITRKDPGLHILSFFLIDYVLKDGGYAILVMPAATFYTEQGSGLKRFLRYRYDVLALVENAKSPSFSSGSGFKEVIVLLRKRMPLQFNAVNTKVYRYDGELKELFSVNLTELPRLMDRNWLSLFDYERARRVVGIIERALDQGLLRYLNKGEIIRGVEMYGPEFFFIPNEYWSVVGEDENHVVIRNGDTTLRIPRKYLVKCMRKPEYYKDEVTVRDPKFYALVIDGEPEGDLREYVRWGERLGVPALQFGERWYQHIWKQIKTKNPFGHVFIHDKVDLTRHRVIANYSEIPLCASKNFYIIREDNPLIAAWLNSSVMRYVFESFSKRISDTWTRLLEEDYLEIPVPSKRVKVEVTLENADRIVSEYLGLGGGNTTALEEALSTTHEL